jgi:hypothetical protein
MFRVNIGLAKRDVLGEQALPNMMFWVNIGIAKRDVLG